MLQAVSWTLGGLCVLFLQAPAVFAQHEILEPVAEQPSDCLSLLSWDPASPIVDWRDSVAVEHCDRIKRLERIAKINSLGAMPLFFDGTVATSRLPPDVRVNLPLLRVVFPERVFFNTDSSELRPEAKEVVRAVAQSLRLEPPDVSLFVAGHADARGSRAYNQNLSVDRANAVAESIMALGVNVASVWRVGFGEDLPLVAGNSADALGQNRRVEFLFAARPEAVAVWLADSQLEILCQGQSTEEMDSCRKNLNLRSDYYAVELGKPSNAVYPSAQDEEVRLATQQVDTSLEAKHVTTHVTTKKEIQTPESTKIAVAPVGTRRIRINPINRKAGPIESSTGAG